MRSRLYRLRILKVPSRDRGDGSANQETQEHPLCFNVAKTTFYQPKIEENYYAAGTEEKHPVQHDESKDLAACTPINGNPVSFSFFIEFARQRKIGKKPNQWRK